VFSLLLNVLSQTQVTLEHFFHHIDCVNNSLGNRIFGFIDSTRESTSWAHGYVLEGLTFFTEKFFYVIFVFDYTFGNY